MAPTLLLHVLLPRAVDNTTTNTGNVGAGKGDWRSHAKPEDFILESWSEGFMVGSLIIMGCITVANMRRGVLLHKFILAEQLLAMSHGTFCFMAFKGYGWYLSSTAALLYCSWVIHNIVAWMKIRPFFCEPRSMFKPKTGLWVRRVYLVSLACTIPPIILQIFDNFRFFNDLSDLYTGVRPYEPLFRDPWWVFTCITLFHVIRKCYGTGVVELIKRSPRFGILLVAIALSLTFTTLDIIASIKDFIGTTDGVNPFWKLSLVMKCLTDTIMLDDFKTELKRLGIKRIQKEEKRRQSVALVLDDKDDEHEHDELEFADSLALTNPAAMKRNGTTTPPSGGRRGAPREQVGRTGTKISHLPGLKSFQFDAIKSTKKKGGDASGSVDGDLEKQQQAVMKKDDDHDLDDDTLDDDLDSSPSRSPRPLDRVAAMRQSLGVIDYRPGH